MILLLLALGCAVEEPEPDETVDSPVLTEPGDYEVGTENLLFTGSSVNHELQLWYPTDEAGSTLHKYGGLIEGGAWDFVEPACDTTRPVLIFSHGYGGTVWQSPFLAERLASHGYVVAAVAHTKNTAFDNDDDAFTEVLLRRPVDVQDAYDFVLDSSSAAGCVDEADGYAVGGHSFGGYTALMTGGATLDGAALSADCPDGPGCEIYEAAGSVDTIDLSDDRVWAVLGLAPWDAGVLDEGTMDIDVPVLLIGADGDTTTRMAMVRRLFSGVVSEPRALVELQDAGHYSFAPVACQILGGNGCGAEFEDPDVLAELTNDLALPFLEITRGTPGVADQFPIEDEAVVVEENVP